MIPKGLFTQIGMVIIAIAIIITYVKPTFTEISEVQDSIEVYQSERAKVESVNEQLATLLSRMEGVSNDDKRRLQTYLPDTVDGISVRRDLTLITQEAGVFYKDTSYGGESYNNSNRNNKTQDEVGGNPTAHSLTLSVEGTYTQLKNLFRLIEQNNYPLEVSSVSIQKIEGNFLSADIDLTTYSYKSIDANN